jgi:hypothetical protein
MQTMRFLLMLPICLLMLTANGSIYLNSGLDSYGKGLTYPEHSSSTFQFSAQNATGFAPFYMDIFLDKLYPANVSASSVASAI